MGSFCSSCGHAVADDARFCSSCGAAIRPAGSPTAAQPAKSNEPIGANVGSWRDRPKPTGATLGSSSRQPKGWTLSPRVSVFIFGVTLATASCIWNVNAASGGGEYPVAGLILLAIGTFTALGVYGMWDQEEKARQAKQQLRASTGNFTAPTIIRSYENNDAGLRQANADAADLARRGYFPVGQSADGGHINLGRTATGAVLTGGLSLLFGGSRTKGRVTITYVKR